MSGVEWRPIDPDPRDEEMNRHVYATMARMQDDLREIGFILSGKPVEIECRVPFAPEQKMLTCVKVAGLLPPAPDEYATSPYRGVAGQIRAWMKERPW